jgi:hypothetical protein
VFDTFFFVFFNITTILFNGTASLILTLGTRWRWHVNFRPWPLYPVQTTLVPIELGVVWAPEPVWMVWRRENLYHSYNSTLSSHQLSHDTDCTTPAAVM